MRLVLAAILLCAAATPALAQSQPQPDKAEAIVRALQNPMVQAGAAAMLGNLADAVLDTRVGPVARYADPTIGEQDTLGDIQRRRDPDFDKHLQADTRRVVAVAAALGQNALEMRASLDETAARLRAALQPLRAALATK
ncbi:hypothetical protein P6144_11860 [Sphingomonas sp. HITSZ_GF]|uniref:hypothetical protein n=1 Tax=Sphingomonas sp. HITSZ_GF TaxID=3037247 RepID=UPI00240E1D97|nr:hypothetical protein [Sphingomonas sp. HITSZ_GF]MDG2534348.1 hypothetical protein [Sphingomonas sp. HITSZ_GF]